MSLLDEECMLPGDVTDITYLDKLNTHLVKNEYYDSRVKSKSDKSLEPGMFRLKHYAGPVEYNVNQFLEKNIDALYKDVMYAMNGSSKPLIKSLFPETNSRGSDFKRPESLGAQFRSSITQLMTNVQSKSLNYVRCIKPNTQKSSDVFDDAAVSN